MCLSARNVVYVITAVAEMTYIVSGGALNSTHSLTYNKGFYETKWFRERQPGLSLVARKTLKNITAEIDDKRCANG